jgi:hypothetical protein
MAVTIRRWLGRTARYLDRNTAMMLAWRMWSDEMVVRQQALDRLLQQVLGPLCARLTASLYDQLNTSSEALLLLQLHLRTQDAEQALDRVSLQLQSMPQDAECLQTAIDLHKTVNDVNAQLFTTIIRISGGSPEARLAAAEHAEDAQAMAGLLRFIVSSKPGPLGQDIYSGPPCIS